MLKILKLPEVFLSSYSWVKAVNRAGRRQYEDSLRYLSKVTETKSTYFEIGMLRSYVYLRLGMVPQSLEEIERVCADIRRIGIENKNIEQYVYAYLATTEELCLQEAPDLKNDYISAIPEQNIHELRRVDLSTIPKRFKEIFPLPIHPDWDE